MGTGSAGACPLYFNGTLMAKPWKTIESIDTDEGVLELRQRDERDFLITVGGLVLMNSMANRSEVVLGQLGCQHLKTQKYIKIISTCLPICFKFDFKKVSRFFEPPFTTLKRWIMASLFIIYVMSSTAPEQNAKRMHKSVRAF